MNMSFLLSTSTMGAALNWQTTNALANAYYRQTANICHGAIQLGVLGSHGDLTRPQKGTPSSPDATSSRPWPMQLQERAAQALCSGVPGVSSAWRTMSAYARQAVSCTSVALPGNGVMQTRAATTSGDRLSKTPNTRDSCRWKALARQHAARGKHVFLCLLGSGNLLNTCTRCPKRLQRTNCRSQICVNRLIICDVKAIAVKLKLIRMKHLHL